MTDRLNAPHFAERLCEHLGSVEPTDEDVVGAKKFVRSRRDLREEPLTRKGHEYVVEALLRPAIESFVKKALPDGGPRMHRRVYSSHFHTTSESEDDWKKEWQNFKTAHGEVDTGDQGHSRRADLFISMGTARLVSVRVQIRACGRRSVGGLDPEANDTTSVETPSEHLGALCRRTRRKCRSCRRLSHSRRITRTERVCCPDQGSRGALSVASIHSFRSRSRRFLWAHRSSRQRFASSGCRHTGEQVASLMERLATRRTGGIRRDSTEPVLQCDGPDERVQVRATF